MEEKKPRWAGGWYEWAEDLISAMILVVLAFTFLFRVVNVSGTSMLPTLQNNDRIVLSTLFYQPKAGDMVVLSRSQKLDEPIVKRIIATENQVVNIDFTTGEVFVDGEKLDETRYLGDTLTNQPSDFAFPLTVPPGHVFVLGDNRAVSKDSRSREVGTVDARYILGKVEWIVFPAARFGKAG